jgi:hypothetical protein
MQESQVGWDISSVDYYIDGTTKFTALYLAVSIVAFAVLAIRFLPALARFRVALAALRSRCTSASAEDSKANAVKALQRQLEKARYGFEVRLTGLRQWAKLTLLVLLAYSAVEIAALFREISFQRKTGISALSGSVANIFALWSPALWFLAALCVAEWILSRQLARSTDVRGH